MTTTIEPSGLRDRAQAVAEKIRPMLTTANNFELRLPGSTVWLEDIHGAGYVAWAEDDRNWDSLTQTVLPELRQPISGADRLPDDDELDAFIAAVKALVNV
jgi:hypothetical protein